jgi:nucleoid DNA-binding protein
MAKTANKKSFKVTPANSRRTRGDVVRQVATATELKPGQVKQVFDALSQLMAADLSKKGCGEFNFNGLMKLKTVNKPATPARKGKNPFTGEEMIFKAKPASRKVRVRALRNLNAMI